ncbi:hypothetical protein ES703_77156 [subsurface metagenome]
MIDGNSTNLPCYLTFFFYARLHVQQGYRVVLGQCIEYPRQHVVNVAVASFPL